jgi:hypothetical protein
MTLIHYKQKVKDNIVHHPAPQDWRLKQWVNNETVQVRRLIKDMEREGLITIEHVHEPSGRVLRILTNKNDILV